MNDLAYALGRAVVIGVGATLIFDLWGLFLKLAFKLPPSNVCLVGRWLRYMPAGTFWHLNLAAAPPKRAECTVGWLAHYLIGIFFAVGFVALAGRQWLESPTLVPALLFGVVTVLAPFFILQPASGLGVAASRARNPAQARLRSLMNHAAFGLGLYATAVSVNPWLFS